MDFTTLLTNFTNPVLLFFILGIAASKMRSDLEIPAAIAKFLSLYLLLAIGFKGGQELRSSEWSAEIGWSLVAGLVLAAVIPLSSFFLLRRKLPVQDSAAIAAAYGSVSAVTFVAAVGFLEGRAIDFGGHMVAVMAFMEFPAIIVGVLLLRVFEVNGDDEPGAHGMKAVLRHSLTNGSVVLLVGSLLVGLASDKTMAEGIKPFTNDIFKGFLALFLLEMGLVCGRSLSNLISKGLFPVGFALVAPLVHGSLVAWASGFFLEEPGNRFLLAVLSASASYIAVPAAMRLAAPKADPGIYIPMALAITFPLNLAAGFPLYFHLAR
ncbi:MAG: hypothetical protein RL173_997 [Fibrobacterota bacterium]|jgi:hypothetical protein